ncbi:MAG: RDD family protein [Phycisphaerae bacterium]|nr:RDD family protein [Saprospiraceae bacterium]
MTILDQPQPQTQSQPIVYASFGERFAARLIDGLILVLPSLFVPFIVPWLYYALQEGSERGATVGKRAMGIRVVSEAGQTIGFGTATGRFFGNFLNLFSLCIGYFLMLFNARSQCLHDLITQTMVIKDNPVMHRQQTNQVRSQKRSWTSKLSPSETHFVEINAEGGRHWHRSVTGEHINDFTLWQLTDGMVDFSAEFGTAAFEEMKQYAEQIMRSRA